MRANSLRGRGATRRGTGRRLGAAAPALAAILLASGAGAAEGGLQLVPDPALLVFLIALFVVLMFPVNALIFRPIFRVLEARTRQVSETRERAESVARQADEVLQRYRESVRAVREEAESDRIQRFEAARGEGTAQLGQARTAAEREIERGRSEVEAALAQARASLQFQAKELARQVASRLLGRPLS